MKNRSTAILIIIGNEILSGRTVDSNVAYLAQKLTAAGIAMKRVHMIADDEAMIITTVLASSKEVDYVFTTGGIGPTHDDITALSMAKAFDVPLILHPEAKALLQQHYGEQLTESRLRMGHVPEGASLIANPVSVAPGFKIRNIYVLAGVPIIAHAMIDMILPTLLGGIPWTAITIRTALAESVIAKDLSRIQEDYPTIEIGSYPYFKLGGYGLSLVVKGSEAHLVDEASHKIQALIVSLGATSWCDENV
ncbi:MAG: competence/damage-inducible protein A [Oligoflexales bacterium]|nr:competence/damage-inducible protein A [Oligoflexales bacterium]